MRVHTASCTLWGELAEPCLRILLHRMFVSGFFVLTVVIFKPLGSFHREGAFSLLRAERYYHDHLLEKRKLPVIFVL